MVYAQTTEIDSLRQLLTHTAADTHRVRLLNDLSYALTQQADHKLALPYAAEASELAIALGDTKGQIGAVFNTGLVHYYDAAYEAAADDFTKAALLNAEIGDREAVANCWNNLANAYHRLGRDSAALVTQEKALALRRELGEDQAIGTSLLGIGITHYRNRDYDAALRYYDDAMHYFKTADYQKGLAVVYNNRGLVFKKRGELAQAAKEILASARIDESLGQQRGAASSYTNVANVYSDLGDLAAARNYHEKALALKRAAGFVPGIASSLTNLADIDREEGRYALAEAHQREAIALKRTLSEPGSLLISLRSMGRIQMAQTRPDSAQRYLMEAWQLRVPDADDLEDARLLATIAEFTRLYPAQARNFPFAAGALTSALATASANQEMDHVRYLLGSLAAAAESQKDYRQALSYHRQLKHLEDSLYTQEQYRIVAELKEQYETADKEKQIIAQQLELARREVVTFRLYVLLLFLSLSLVALVVFFRQRQLLQQQRLLAGTERERSIRLQSMVDGREDERRRVARDLHDGLGGLLSTVKLQLNAMGEKVAFLTDQPTYAKASNLVETACEEVRRIAHELLPDALLQLGFAEAATELVEHHHQASGTNFSIEVLGPPVDFTNEQKLLLYRVLQEMLQNVVKHAAAENVWVRLTYDTGAFSLSVEDDGLGFNRQNKGRGIGLAGLTARAERLGATLTVESEPGRGCFFELYLPGRIVVASA